MNAGTSLRAEGVIIRLAASNIAFQVLDVTCKLRPAVAAFLRAHWFAEAPQSDVIVPR
jgi:hypothetical protein